MKPLVKMLTAVSVTGLVFGSVATPAAASDAPSVQRAGAAAAQLTSGAVITDIRFGPWAYEDVRRRIDVEFEVADPNPLHLYTLEKVVHDPGLDDNGWWSADGLRVHVDTDPTSPTYGKGIGSFHIDVELQDEDVLEMEDGLQPDLLAGETYTFWVEAHDGDPYDGGVRLWSGPRRDHQMPRAVGHPSVVEVVGELVPSQWSDEGWAVVAGRTYTIRSTGAWEEGATFSHHVRYRGADGQVTLASGKGLPRPLTTFTPTAKHVDGEFRVSIFGNKEGRVSRSYDWVFEVIGHRDPEGSAPTPMKILPKAWVKSYGKKKGQARVARSVRVTQPNFSTAGQKQKLKVTYQWFSGGKAIKGVKAKKRTFKLRKAQRNKRLTVKVTVTKKGYKSRTKTISFGKVKAARKR